MTVIGLTGTSGSGKGYVCALLNERGIPSIDTDAIVHGIYTPGTPCVVELAHAFGDRILHSDGSVNRKMLASIVFSDFEKLDQLNGIVHRYVLDAVRAKLRVFSESGSSIAFVDAPQLFESGFDRECDFTVAITADPSVRLARLRNRDSLPPEQIQSRMNNQHDDRFFEENCDFVIQNNGFEDVGIQLDAILAKLSDGKGELP